MSRKELQQELAKLKLLTDPESIKSGKPQGGMAAAGGQEGRGRGMRQAGGGRPGSDGPMSTPGGMAGRGQPEGAQAAGDEELRRGVIIQQGNEYAIRMVKTGVSSLDQTEVLSGLAENDQVVYTFYSRATEASAQQRERMTAMQSQRSGFRSN